jgi:hypothetical protein
MLPMSKPTEDDVPLDAHVANARPVTEDGDPEEPAGTTGPGDSGEFVGRVQGQDEGYAGETGAERRAAVEEERRAAVEVERPAAGDTPDA